MALLRRSSVAKVQPVADPLPLSATPAQTAAASDVSDKERTIEYGSSGTINYQGFLQSEEYNVDLQPPQSFAIYDRMAVSDSTTRATMLHLTTPVKAGEWRIQPASDSDEDLEIAAFIHNNLFEWMQYSWEDCMDDQLKYLRWGNAVFEEVWESREVGWEYRRPGEGDAVQVPPRTCYTLRKMAPRLPRTIWRWINDVSTGELAVIQTRTYKATPSGVGMYATIDIPANKCLILSNEKVGDDWWGVSMLRGAYKPWWLLEAMQRITAIGYERYYVGTPMARMNQNATDSQRNKMLTLLTALRSGERSAVVYSASDGLDCEDEGSNTGSGGNTHAMWILQPDKAPPDAVPWIRQLESNIFTSIMARFMDLGQKETGARATAEIQDDPFYLGLVAIANHIAEQWNRGPIKRLVDANFPNVTKYPRLEATRIAPMDIPIIAAAAAAYAGSGFLTPDFATEQWIRKQLNMPDKIITDDDIDDDAVASDGEQSKQYPSILGLQQQANQQAAKAAKDGNDIKSAQAVRPPVQARASKGTADSGSGTALADDPTLAFAPKRELHPDEAHVDFHEISQRIDEARHRFVGGVNSAVIQVEERFVRDLSELVDARSVGATRAKDLGFLTSAIQDHLLGIASFGYQSVEQEIRKQSGVLLDATIHDSMLSSGATEHIHRVAEAAAASMAAGLEQVGKVETLAQIRRHGRVVDVERVQNLVRNEAHRQANLHGMLLTTEALNIGRNAAADEHADDIKRVRYTSMMDRAACGPCESSDGTVTQFMSETYKLLDPPNPRCEGGPRCRCIWVYLT